jgi:hypothetical protein
MASTRNRISYPFWAESPNLALIRQLSPSIESNSMLDYLWRHAEHFLGSPFIEFCILNEIFEAVQDFSYKEPIAIDVILNREAFQKCNRLTAHQEGHILRDLGAWLTQQIASARAEEQIAQLKFPETIVRCLWSDPSKTLRGSSKVPRIWQMNRVIKLAEIQEPYFMLQIPSQIGTGPFQANFRIVSPGPEQKLDLNLNQSTKIGIDVLPPPMQEFLPMVACEHVELLAITYPSDGTPQLWIRHLGNHETWIGNAKKWQPISRGMWFPLNTGNFIILGRVPLTSNGRKILPGSLILQVQENE